jgi:acyl-CoA synthetase (AMP-forming)/AMP-acid ligase II/3-hydroxymyristoyl/3-hydroxydecanoyl-(acyl carrier protein) dehydratase
LRPTLEFRRGDDLVVHAFAPPEAAWFQGHFPGAPLLPGVAMLALVEESLALFWHGPGRAPARVESFRRIRFRQRVVPLANLRLRVHQIEPSRFRFVVEVGGAAACTGECRTADTALPSFEKRGPVLPPAFVRGEMANARFCSDGTTLGEVVARATGLRALVATGASVCVASEDRVDVAAALVAALCGGIEAVFPPALAAEALLATYRALPFAHWLGPAAWLADLPELGPLRIEATSAPAQALALAPLDETRVVLHTGGTTGQPRPWRKTARNLLDEVAAHTHGLQVLPTDHIVATVPPHHIYGLLFSVLLPLHSGASVERHSPFYPEEIAERIAGTSATILVSTPAHLRALATSLTTRHQLRLVLSSGAPLSASDAAAFAASTGLWPLEVYGSTETGGIAVRRQDQRDSPWAPLPGVDCRVDGRSDGEALAVRSAYVSSDAGADPDGFFTTADLASLRADGTFDPLGRSDGIVKVGGQRVALPDIERALAGLDHVADAVVIALPAQSGRGQEIFALVASPRGADDLVQELRARLPSPAWPRRVRCVDAIPTTSSGKRDRAAILRLLDVSDSAGE